MGIFPAQRVAVNRGAAGESFSPITERLELAGSHHQFLRAVVGRGRLWQAAKARQLPPQTCYGWKYFWKARN